MVLSDRDIKNYIHEKKLVITPLSSDTVRENGVDLKVGDQIARFLKLAEPVDVDNPEEIKKAYVVTHGHEFIIGPHEHVLLTTLEYVKMPNDLVGFVNLRSTFARLGLFIPPTIIDAGFEGQITIELVGSEFPVRLKKGTRFIHVIFAKTTTPVENPYRGKYMGQTGVTLPKAP
ncbi:MAG: deoxycytidine triphosphate deaminase [Candidatus Aramenus sulfurataquae]|uniref:dCTP deaminase n=1 Tax=Candidatus Aramenus sulfurataquae TaxID=1326980 RepID=W7KV07_9CREN|nr:MAG: deoxycytidine triphosphate deaminase [Candidatus Aramenus sulfurataquae]